MEETELRENYQDLCSMVEAIETGQVERARELAQHHVARFNRYMQEKKEAGASG